VQSQGAYYARWVTCTALLSSVVKKLLLNPSIGLMQLQISFCHTVTAEEVKEFIPEYTPLYH
jgi:hypothetical protein